MIKKEEKDQCKGCEKLIDPNTLIVQVVTFHVYRCCPSCGYPYDRKTGVGKFSVNEQHDQVKDFVG
ncbi:MAG: hypothetical protein ACFFCQ_04125 [Promethearchaeota archaeon]